MLKPELPSAYDWLKISQDFVRVINELNKKLGWPLYPMPTEPGIPSEELLDEWEKAYPGSKAKWIELAHEEMRHRKLIEELKKPVLRTWIKTLLGQ